MHIVVHSAMAEINAGQWNAMLDDNNPFMRYEFLHGLELSGCVCEASGWQPMHIATYNNSGQQTLLGAMPCYLKTHSYGEYIFDWGWAEAYHRHGLDYYPKLSNAVPFTPATGPRWLVADASDEEVVAALLEKAKSLVGEYKASGFHSLFLNAEQSRQATKMGLSPRLSSQFHWRNCGYRHFDDYLNRMTSKKRKNIKRERRRVKESDIRYHWYSGADLTPSRVVQMWQFYRRTIAYYGAQAYLNRSFFAYLANNFAEQTLFLFAYHHDQVIAGGLYFRSDTTLYGRYWGALDNFHSVHFETCYYQAIEWCITNGYQQFEAGAQGQHKLSRGLEPATTFSAHWIADSRFRVAIDEFLMQEGEHNERYQADLRLHSPFNKGRRRD